jgi:two-component sensor histidine kinase
VTPPSAHGFGTRLITATLKQFGGTIETDFAPTGLVCKLEFSLD